ncbi:MAG: hypothetical protein ACRCTZ_06365 [Sarcina sp.]
MLILKVKNFLDIEEANIDLTTKSIIIGYNSTSKSMLMKLGYAMLRSLKEIHLYVMNIKNIDEKEKKQIIGKNFIEAFGETIVGLFRKETLVELYNDESLIISVNLSEPKAKIESGTFDHLKSTVLYLSSTSILDNYKSIASGTPTGLNGIATLSDSTCMAYDKEMLQAIFIGQTNSIDNWTGKGIIKQSNNDLIIDEKNNVLLKDKGKYRNIQLVGNGIRLQNILKNIEKSGALQGETSYIFIDEPENGINPRLQGNIASILSNRNYNIMYTTHSPFMIRYSDAKSSKYYLSSKGEKGVNFIEVEYEDALDFLSKPILGLY